MNKFIYHRYNNDEFHTHVKLLKRVPANSTVLEIGSATGYLTEKLLAKNCKVISVEKDKVMAAYAKNKLNSTIINCDVGKIEKHLSAEKNKFDVILLADVLEHLSDPYEVVETLKKYMKPKSKMIISVPNIANFAIRFNLLFFGRFDYQNFGILDKTHLKFFTKDTIERLFSDTGLKVIHFDAVAGFEVSKFYRLTVGRVTFRVRQLRSVEYLITRIFPRFFALEFIYEVKIT